MKTLTRHILMSSRRSRALWQVIDTATLTNTTDETEMLSDVSFVGRKTLLKEEVYKGSTFQLRSSGTLSCGANQTTTLKIALGATTLHSSSLLLTNNLSNVYFDLYFDFTFREPTGTTFPLIGQGRTLIIASGVLTPASRPIIMAAPINIDVSTNTLQLSCTYQWQTALVANVLTVTNASIQHSY